MNGYTFKAKEAEEMLERIHIYDVDGVLLDSTHRFRTLPCGIVDLAHWTDNRHFACNDTYLPLARQFIEDCLAPEVYTIVCTARQMHLEEWLAWERLFPMPDQFLSRAKGDSRGSIAMKTAKLRKVLSLRQFSGLPRVYWEDTKDILDAVSAAVGARGVFVQSSQGCWN